jgi:hypothetical protein
VKFLCNLALTVDALLNIQLQVGIRIYVPVTHNNFCDNSFSSSKSLHSPVRWHDPELNIFRLTANHSEGSVLQSLSRSGVKI